MDVRKIKIQSYFLKLLKIKLWFLFKKKKCMVLIYSLIEMNSDSSAIRRIMRSLSLEILKKNLR